MRFRMGAAVVGLLSVAVLAGCLGGGNGSSGGQEDGGLMEPVEDASGTDEAATAPMGGEGAAQAQEPVRQGVSFAWNGRLGHTVCAPSGTSSCTYHYVTPSENSTAVALEGEPVAVDLNLTWEPMEPFTGEMRFALVEVRDGAISSLAAATGGSPLRLQADPLGPARPGSELRLIVQVPLLVSGLPSAGFHLETPFEVEGTFVALVGDPTAA